MIRTRMPGLETLALLAIVAVVTCYRFWQLPNFPYHEDETATITAMQSIVRSGLPLMDTGQLYWRALVAHYIMAVPLFFVPVSEFSVRLVPVLSGSGVLLVCFAMARAAGGRLAAWLCVAMLALSSFEQGFSSFARFYMLFQLFFMASLYFAGRYLVCGRNADGKWYFLFTILAAGSHEMSVEIIPLSMLALLIGKHFQLLKKTSFWIGCAGLAITFAVVYLYPKGSYVNYLAAPLKPFEMQNKFFFYENLKLFAPLCLSLGLVGWAVVWTQENRIWRFYLLSFWVCLILVSLVSPAEILRYMANFFPLVVILAAVGVSWLLQSGRKLLTLPRGKLALLRWCAACLLVLMHLLFGRDRETGVAFGQALKAPDQKPAHIYLQQHMADQDLLISLEPGLSAIYLGRPADYFLREKFERKKQKFSTYSDLEKSAMSIGVLDSPVALKTLLGRHRGRVWIFANHKFNASLSPQMHDFIRSNFKLELVQGGTAVFSADGQGDLSR